MNIQEIEDYFICKHGAVQKTPFKMPVPVFMVGEKIFALINIHEEKRSINLKYPSDSIEQLRSSFEEIQPGYHMNKGHWNTVYFEGLEDVLVKELIDISYDLVVASLSKAKKNELI